MPDLAELLRAGGNGWLYLPVAVLLGALHGLEPGHSKTMMAAYIVAITVMVACAIASAGPQGAWLPIVGAVAFYLSDLSVARDVFVHRAFVNRLWGLPLYYAAQLCLAATV